MTENDSLTVHETITPPSSSQDLSWLAGVVKRFEEAWLRNEKPAIDDFLPLSEGERRVALIELVHIDLELRLRGGEVARVETYIQHYPELTSDREVMLGLIADEFRLRRQREPGLVHNAYLVRFSEYAGELSERLARLAAASSDSANASGPSTDSPSINGYEILEKIGWGGMGIVYKARQLSLNRLVAIKVIRTERWTNSENAIRRFIREAHAAAQLLHSHIVTIYDAGQNGDTHFIVMEYVEGVDLEKLVRTSGPLAILQACEYVRQIALGLQHAFERGLVHRDIKPANLIVSPPPLQPARGPSEPGNGDEPRALPFRDSIVKILDMGLARVDQCLAEEELLETPATDSDGLTLYGAAMGTPDFMAPEQADDAHSADIRSDLYSLGCTFYFLLTGKVPFPAGSSADKRQRHLHDEPIPLVRLRPEVPTGVVHIVQTLMAKQPEDRYQTPGQLVEVLKSVARSYHPVDLDPLKQDKKPKSSGEFRLPKFIPPSETEHFTLERVGELHCYRGHDDWVMSVAFSADGRRLLSGSRDRSMRLWDLKTGKEVRRFLGHDGDVFSVAFSSDSQQLLSGGGDRVVRLWNAVSGRELRPFEGHTDDVISVLFFPESYESQTSWHWLSNMANLSVAFSSEGRMLLTGSRDGTVRLWDMESGLELRRLNSHSEVVGCTFSSDGLSALTSSANNIVRLWAIEKGRELCRFDGHENFFWCIALSPDGRRVLTGGEDKSVRLWDIENGQELRRCDGHTDWVTCVAFSPDGCFALSGSNDCTLRLWHIDTGHELCRFEGHTDGITSAAFSPDGSLALSGSADKTLRCWRLPGR